jgi:hypothetical protein
MGAFNIFCGFALNTTKKERKRERERERKEGKREEEFDVARALE